MRILIVFDQTDSTSSPDQADALIQARTIASALDALGHEWTTLGVTLDLQAASDAILRFAPDVVFNIVESLGGSGRLLHALPALLDVLKVAYTGASAEMQFITSHKPLAKQLLREAGIATPKWLTIEQLRATLDADDAPPLPCKRWIMKSLWEHASVGLDDASVIESDDAPTIHHALKSKLDRLGGSAFAEEYIDGRELNVALLARNVDERSGVREPECLPVAEIVFRDYPAGRPRIVNYACKWDEQSFEFAHAERVFDFPSRDASLLQRVREIAVDCWRLFDLRGYARIDFRVDERNQPWVLEVNTNPCLSPDAGFAAALSRGSISYSAAIESIINDALRSRCQSRDTNEVA